MVSPAYSGATLGVVDIETSNLAARQSCDIPLDKIKIWTGQPRQMKLSCEDVIRGQIDPSDPDYKLKIRELEALEPLAINLKEHGLNNALIGYRLPDGDVCVIAGNRRFFAAIFGLYHLHKELIDGTAVWRVAINPEPDKSFMLSEHLRVEVYLNKPCDRDLRLLAMIDNTNREDVVFRDKLAWALNHCDQTEGEGAKITAQELIRGLNLKRSQSFKWHKVLQNRQAPTMGKAISLAMSGLATFNQLHEIACADTEEAADEIYQQRLGAGGRQKTNISVKISNADALRIMIERIAPSIDVESIDWDNAKDIQRIFDKFMTHWEDLH